MKKDIFHYRILKKIEKIIYHYNNKKFDPKRSSNFYFDSTSDSGDFIFLKYLFKKILFFRYFKLILKDILYSVYYGNPIIYNGNLLSKKYSKIIVSWSNEKSFKKDGSHQDKFFNINSSVNKKILWFLISNEKPQKKLQKNIVVIQLRNKKKIYLLNFLKNIIKNFKLILKDFRFFINSIGCNSFIAQNILKNFKRFFHPNVTHILMPYESQPFQNEIFRFAKERNKNIKTIGYIHSPPLALPTKFIYKHGSPDQIILNGDDQLKCFKNYLGWKISKMKVVASDRFYKSKKNLGGHIFLPLTIRSEYNIIEGIKYLLEKKYINPNYLKIRNHPAVENSLKHNYLIKKLDKLLKQNKKPINLKKKTKYSIFIGSSGAIIEALERKTQVYQICEDPLFDKYSKDIWNNLIVKQISKNVFSYNLKKSGKLIKFGNKKTNLKKYFL